MEAAAEAFNKVPRPQKTPGGLPNHWFFTVRHVPLNPPGDLVHLVHPQSQLVHVEGPRQIASLPSAAVKAEAVVPLLLKTFISGLSTGPDGKPLEGVQRMVPWSWGTNDAELAKAVENHLKAIGVREELCHVQVGNKEHQKISDQAWSKFLAELTKQAGQAAGPGTGKICAKCKTGGSLKQCAKCKNEYYCSRDCQTADWKQHKKACASLAAAASRGETGEDALNYYYNNQAHRSAEAQELARSLNITIPVGGNEPLLKPVRRLIIAGKDTIGNFQHLFGPQWKPATASILEDTRMDVLLRPPPGSPSYSVHHKYDQDVPSWSPRPATTEENQKVQEIREMQDLIKSRVGPGKSPNMDDMKSILTTFGAGWGDKIKVYQTALNSLDQGVQA